MDYLKSYDGDFSEAGFQRFVGRFKSLSFIRNAVTMYFCFADPETDKVTKGIIIAALGYMICPIDVIPDIIPIIGFLDDAGVIAMAFFRIQSQIKDKHRQRADEFLMM